MYSAKLEEHEIERKYYSPQSRGHGLFILTKDILQKKDQAEKPGEREAKSSLHLGKIPKRQKNTA
jgi:hypothetical protein